MRVLRVYQVLEHGFVKAMPGELLWGPVAGGDHHAACLGEALQQGLEGDS